MGRGRVSGRSRFQTHYPARSEFNHEAVSQDPWIDPTYRIWFGDLRYVHMFRDHGVFVCLSRGAHGLARFVANREQSPLERDHTETINMGIRALSTFMLWHVAMCQIICKDGTPDDYNCGVDLKCAKGQCIGIAKKLCTDAADGAVDYVCDTAEKCGRGICVRTTDTLCGTSGSTTCAITQTCCGVTAATKNSDMVCNAMMDPCPEDRKSDIYDHPAWYSYSADGGSSGSSSAAASLGSGALGTTLFAAVATATLLRCATPSTVV